MIKHYIQVKVKLSPILLFQNTAATYLMKKESVFLKLRLSPIQVSVLSMKIKNIPFGLTITDWIFLKEKDCKEDF